MVPNLVHRKPDGRLARASTGEHTLLLAKNLQIDDLVKCDCGIHIRYPVRMIWHLGNIMTARWTLHVPLAPPHDL